ncbi:MAG: VOC family protein [Planctomycetota bacterium]|nr:MAG: VOC family protein [Planctomycetota bacterium]
MNRVVHFEIHADDPERAIAFYSEAFAWTFHAFGEGMEYWTIVTGPEDQPGINGGLVRRQGGRPDEGQAVTAFVCTVSVASVDEAAARVVAAGGRIVVPKFEVPGVGWCCYAKDTEGNILGLFEDAA